MIAVQERGHGFVEVAGHATNEQLSVALAASRAGRAKPADEDLGFDVPLAADGEQPSTESAPTPAAPAESAVNNDTPSESPAATAKDSSAQPGDSLANLLAKLAKLQDEQRKVDNRTLEAEIQRTRKLIFEVQNRTPEDRHEAHDHCLLAKLRERTDVKEASATLALAFADWQGETERLDQAGLLPGSRDRRIAELEKSAAESGSCDDLTVAAKRISELKSVSQSMTTAACMTVNSKLAACAEPFERLMNVYDAALLELREEAEIAEEVFFAGHGLPRTPTPVSGRVTAAQAVIARARQQIARLKGDDGLGATALRSWALPAFCNVGE